VPFEYGRGIDRPVADSTSYVNIVDSAIDVREYIDVDCHVDDISTYPRGDRRMGCLLGRMGAGAGFG
jgi:hypothetical protein